MERLPDDLPYDPVDDAVRVNTPAEWEKVLADQRTLGEKDFRPFDNFPGTVQQTERLLEDYVRDKFSGIDPQKIQAVRLYFGLDSKGQVRSYAEVGREIGLTRQSARRRVLSGLEQIRHPRGPQLRKLLS